MAKVSLAGTESYGEKTIRAAVDRHFDLLDVRIPRDTPVVIKPNLILRCAPELAATTHPAILEAALARLRDMGVRDIRVAESPGGPFTPGILKGLFQKTGIAAAAEKYGVACVVSTESKRVCRPENEVCREFDLLAPIAEGAFLINLCKVKTHGMMTYSGGVKNLFGCVPGLLKPQLHYQFPEEGRFAAMLVDLSLTVRPALTIADGVVGMEGDGPTAGSPKKLGITAAALFDGLYELDETLARMIGFAPERIPTVAEARRRGLCGAPEYLGDAALANTVTPFTPPTGKTLDFAANAGIFGPLVRKLKPYLSPRPVVRFSGCVGCGRCAETCPAHVIEIREGKARISPRGCIHCFCCHEMCPKGSIEIRETGLFRLLSR